MQIVPHVQSIGKRLDLVESPLEEITHHNGFAGERIFDLRPQTMFGSKFFVSAGSGNIFAVIAESTRKFWIRVDLQHEQIAEGEIGNVEVEAVCAFIHPNFYTSHRKIDTCHQVLSFDLACHFLRRGGLTCSEKSAGIERFELFACGGNDAFDWFGETTGANGRPVVVTKTHSTADKVIRNLQVIVVRAIQVG